MTISKSGHPARSERRKGTQRKETKPMSEESKKLNPDDLDKVAGGSFSDPCAVCGKRPAICNVLREIDGVSVPQGLCFLCAKELKLPLN